MTDNASPANSSHTNVLNILNNANYTYINNNNGPFAFTPSTISGGAFVPETGLFYNKSFACYSTAPTTMSIRWIGYENDELVNYGITSANIDGQTAIQDTVIEVPQANGSHNFVFTAVSIDAGCPQTYELTLTLIRTTELFVPIAIPTLASQSICPDQTTTLVAGNVNGSGDISYDWSHNGLGDFTDEDTITGVTPGVYTLIVKDEVGCTDTAEVEILALPTVQPITHFVDFVEEVCANTADVTSKGKATVLRVVKY